MELDESGSIISYEEYHPYGTTSYQAINTSINAVAKRYRYTGKERDEESGLYYHGARYYIPWLARWTAVDPMESKYAGMSPYNYCFNNPVMWNDLSGANPGDDNELNRMSGSSPNNNEENKVDNTDDTIDNTDNANSIDSEAGSGSGTSKETDWLPLNAIKLDELTGKSASTSGFVLEDLWYRWTTSSFAFSSLGYMKQSTSDQYNAPDWNRNVAFDGKSYSVNVELFNPNKKNKLDIDFGVVMYEV